jgi:hypothetical protein
VAKYSNTTIDKSSLFCQSELISDSFLITIII